MENPRNYFIVRFAEELLPRAYAFTRALPREERFNFVSQIRRAAKSSVDNTREGCSRQGDRAMLPFLYDANGSATELVGHFRDAHTLGLGDADTAKYLARQYGRLQLMVARLIRAKESRLGEANPRRRRQPRRTK